MNEHLTVRAATPADYELVLALFLDLRRFSRERHPPQADDFELVLAASRDYLREILARGPEARTFLALAGDVLAGYLVAVVHEPNPLSSAGAVRSGVIDELFVDGAQRGRGAGHALLAACLNWLNAQGVERVTVGAYAWNAEALRFYERAGFRPWTVTLVRGMSEA
jgi:ribosomal protein S18 acetylase RimI-like enzyme